MRTHAWKAIALFCFIVEAAFALKTAYLTFDHPEGWRCELVEGVWICQSTVDTDRRESVVLAIATLATDWDNVDNYLGYLKETRTIRDADGKEITSQVAYARKRNINGVVWVDSLQHDAELPGFWTRYLATVHNTPKAKLAILVTYVVSDERYDAMAPRFERMVSTLKPNSDFDLDIATKQGDGPIPGAARLGKTQSILAERLNVKKKKAEPQASTETSLNWLIIVLLIMVILLVYRIRGSRRRKSGGSPREPGQMG